MKYTLVIMFFGLNILTAFATTASYYKIETEKITFTSSNFNKEYRFKYNCITSTIEDYLKVTLSKKEYKEFPRIEFSVSSFNNHNSLRIRKTGFFIMLHDTTIMTERVLKVFKHLTFNYTDYIARHSDEENKQLLDKNDFRHLYATELDKTQKKLLAKEYYRAFGYTDKSLHENTLYSYSNDSIYVFCKKRVLLKLDNISGILDTDHLGFFIFDTDSSFYHINPYYEHHPTEDREKWLKPGYERNIIYGKLSKRHEFEKGYSCDFELLYEDIDNYQVCFYYNIGRSSFRYPGSRLSFSLGKFNSKEKFLYLVNDDILISNYNELEQELIDNIKNDDR
ncbi:hypothetical protein [Saccharicrinis aurantiacus]|uniref:hypothetical protein n=1 Tax=Saccharicrinis aurantiacus TaxID=1849719 RepID=UPI00094FC2F0|nr:hypothetical protein [Saccharicrinis aurantiacus]